jgi:radical SAM superfamily enzyme YgiQ (UPF0313 family)
MQPKNNRQILLINPWIHDFSAHDLWLKPLGLLYIGSHLEKYGYNVQLVDCLDYQKIATSYGCHRFYSEPITKPCHFQNIPRKYKRYGMPPYVLTRLLSEINDKTTPLLIAVTSMMTYWYPGVFDTIKYIKHIFNDTPVVLGGVYATLCYEHAKKLSGADYVIKDHGEEEILKLANRLSGENHNTIISDSAIPAYHLYDSNNTKSLAMITSRGCPFRCSYCASAFLSNDFTQRPPEDVVSEIEYYQKSFGTADIAFYDDALLVNREKHINIILDLIIQRGLNKKIQFHAPNGFHIRYIDKTLAQKLYQANFKTIRLGFESVEREGDSDHKVSKDNLPKVIEDLKQAGFTANNIGVYILMGLPGQNLQEVERTIEFVHKLGALIKIAQYSPVPHSSDFNKVIVDYPEIATEPLLQNKSVYYCHDRGAKFEKFETLKNKVRQLNEKIG